MNLLQYTAMVVNLFQIRLVLLLSHLVRDRHCVVLRLMVGNLPTTAVLGTLQPSTNEEYYFWRSLPLYVM